MADDMVVQWQNSYSVGVKLIDEQHMELIRLTNKLFYNCMAGLERGNSAFIDTIHEAVDYAGYHFGTEEKVMERINYPDYTRHKQEHIDFVKQVCVKVDDFASGKMHAPIQFVYFLRDWVLHHIAVCDKKMGDYILALKRNGDLQRMTLKIKRDMSTNRMSIR
jgi:hemerythrin-like metal-binding protein